MQSLRTAGLRGAARWPSRWPRGGPRRALAAAPRAAGVCAAYCAHTPLSLQAVALHFASAGTLVGAAGRASATAGPAAPLPDASDVLRVPLLCVGDEHGGETAASRVAPPRVAASRVAPPRVAPPRAVAAGDAEGEADESPRPAHAFFFRSGAVVFWDVPLSVRREVLRRTTELFGAGAQQQVVKRHPRTPAPMSIRMEEFEHEFKFHVDPEKGGGSGGRRRATFINDQIYVRDMDDTSEMLAVSYGLAQSVKLHMHEVALDALVQRTERLPVELARRGRISMSATDIRKLIGELLAARYSANLVSDILDIPEYLWRRPELEPVYVECKAAVELRQRSRILDARAEVVRDALHMLNSELATAHSARLERSILFLIGVEVLFEVARFSGM